MGAELSAGPDRHRLHPQLHVDLDHLGALAAAAAIRARLAFTARLTARGGLLSLPALGAVRMPDGRIDITSTGRELTLRHRPEKPLVVHVHADDTTSSPDPRWLPALSLPAVLPGAGPVRWTISTRTAPPAAVWNATD